MATHAARRSSRTDVAEIVLDSANVGQTCSAAPGDVVVVRLGETPTSGYRWEVESVDSAVLEPVGDDYTPPSDSTLGGDGVHAFSFRVVAPGDGALKLVLRRSWETDRSGTESFEVSIHAED